MGFATWFRSLIASWRAEWRAGIARLGIAALILATLHLDPFGINSAAADQSAEAHFRITAPLYASEGQDRVTVVLIDDQLLERLGVSWPLSYAAQGVLLRKILGYQPEAVFLDIGYQRPHSGGDSDRPVDMFNALGSSRELVADGRIPVYAAVQPIEFDSGESLVICGPNAQAARGSPRILPELTAAGVRPVFVGWEGCGNDYPLFLYGDPARATAAFALYRDIFCPGRRTAGCVAALSTDAKRAVDAFSEPLQVVWGALPSAAHMRLSQAGGVECVATGSSGWERIKSSVGQIFLSLGDAFAPHAVRGARMVCPHTDVLSANWLYGAYGEEVRKFLENRIVLVGTHISGTGDLVRNPVNGQVPGVLLHAMALDNLIKYGAGYQRPLSDLAFIAIEAVLLLLVVALHGPVPARKTRGPAPRRLRMPAFSALVWLIVVAYLVFHGSYLLATIGVVLFAGWDLIEPDATGTLVVLATCGLVIGIAIGWWSNGGPINWASVVAGLVGLAAFEHTRQGPPGISGDSLLQAARRCYSKYVK